MEYGKLNLLKRVVTINEYFNFAGLRLLARIHKASGIINQFSIKAKNLKFTKAQTLKPRSPTTSPNPILPFCPLPPTTPLIPMKPLSPPAPTSPESEMRLIRLSISNRIDVTKSKS